MQPFQRDSAERSLGKETSQYIKHLNISIPGIDAPSLITRIGHQLALWAGAACHSGSTEISYVMKAMGKTSDLTRSALRLTTWRMITEDEIREAQEIIKARHRRGGGNLSTIGHPGGRSHDG